MTIVIIILALWSFSPSTDNRRWLTRFRAAPHVYQLSKCILPSDQVHMPIDHASLQEPFRKLRKTLKGFPEGASPKDVHRLRTRIRRTEATARPNS